MCGDKNRNKKNTPTAAAESIAGRIRILYFIIVRIYLYIIYVVRVAPAFVRFLSSRL